MYRIPAQTVADHATWTVISANWSARSGGGMVILDNTLIYPVGDAIYTCDLVALEARIQQGVKLNKHIDAPKIHRLNGCFNCGFKRVQLTNGTEVGVLFPGNGQSDVYMVSWRHRTARAARHTFS